MSFAVLSYSGSINLGDEIQSLAAKRMLKLAGAEVAHYYDRDTCDLDPPTQGERVHLIFNGWFDGAYNTWPDTEKYHAYVISAHINENKKNATYDWLDKRKNFTSLADPTHNHFLSGRKIGCRDIHTYALLVRALQTTKLEKPIELYISGCLTSTLAA